MLPKYKANRTKPAPAFSVDLSNLKLLLRFTRIPTLTVPGYEADDVSDAVSRVFDVAGLPHRTEQLQGPVPSVSCCWAVRHNSGPVLLRLLQVMAGLAAQAKQAGYQTLLISTDKDLWQVGGDLKHSANSFQPGRSCQPPRI
jgi:5'-3' exonuclease